MKVKLFKSKMALNGDDIESLSEFLGVSRQTLSAKINGKYQFKQNEITKIAARWNLTPEDVYEVFHDSEVE